MTDNMTTNSNNVPQPVLRIVDGKIIADSRDVARTFDRTHFNVLQAIRNLECSDEFRRMNFKSFEINDLTGTSTSHVEMTRDGFSFLAMGFTGSKAAPWKERFIAAFNQMEAELLARPAPAIDYSDPAVLLGVLGALQSKVATQEAQLAVAAPKVEVADRLVQSFGSLCRTDAAKSLGVPPHALIRWLREHGWTYRRAGTSEDIAYQGKIAQGLLEHKVTIVSRDDGTDRTVTQVRVTPKGLAALVGEVG